MDEEKSIEQVTLDDLEETIRIFETKSDALMEVDQKHLSEHDLDIELKRLEHKFCVAVCAIMQHYQLNK